MRNMKRRLSSFEIWIGLAAVGIASVAVGFAQTIPDSAEPLEVKDPSPPWVELEYRLRKFFLTATTKARLDFVAPSAITDLLRIAPASSAKPLPVERVACLTVESILPFGRSEVMRVWFDPTSGAAIQSDRVVVGRRTNHTVWRYLAGGIYVWTWSPADKREEKLSAESWSDLRERFVPYPAEIPADGVVIDAYSLIYLARCVNHDRADTSRHFFVLSYHGFLALDYARQNYEQKRIEVVEEKTGNKHMRENLMLLRSLHISTRAVPENPAATPHDLSLLGFLGGVTVLLEPQTGIPFALQGRAAYIGTLNSELVRVRYASDNSGS